MDKNWHGAAWNDYMYWLEHDRKVLRRINALLKDIERHPFNGIGDPEPLKHDLSGWWSRHIDRANRIVYRVAGDRVDIMRCRGHYGIRG